ncbi:MAG: hypothetical protein QXO33_04130 [Nitrososphaeria archaeon]
MPRGRWKKEIFTKNPILFFMSFETDQRKRPEYLQNLKDIVCLIFNNINTIINYAHVSFIVPKQNLPLKVHGEHYDVVYLDREFNLVCIKIKVIPRNEVIDSRWIEQCRKQNQN